MSYEESDDRAKVSEEGLFPKDYDPSKDRYAIVGSGHFMGWKQGCYCPKHLSDSQCTWGRSIIGAKCTTLQANKGYYSLKDSKTSELPVINDKVLCARFTSSYNYFEAAKPLPDKDGVLWCKDGEILCGKRDVYSQ